MSEIDVGEIAPFKPSLLYWPEAEALEFLAEDCACFYDEPGPVHGWAIIRRMSDNHPIGFRLFVDRATVAAALQQKANSP